MAKKSKIVKNDQRLDIVARYAPSGGELKRIIRTPAAHLNSDWPLSARWRANPAMPAPVAGKNDAVDGRPRGHLRKFGLSRVRVREMAHQGSFRVSGKRVGNGPEIQAHPTRPRTRDETSPSGIC